MAAPVLGSFGMLLKQQRLAAGLTQEALAERAGVSAKAVSDLERDPARTPRLDTVTLLANALLLEPEERARLLAAARPDRGPPETPLAAERAGNSLPRPLTPLFGRAGVAGAVAQLVRRDDVQLLTLTGPGGVGKTRLAIAAAELAADAFPDGVVFVDLAPLRDPNLVLATVARRLGFDERDPNPLHERLIAALRRKRLLLLLDNFERLLGAREAVLALLDACPGLVVLTTSRVALRVRGEREYRVAPLELPAETGSLEAMARSPAVALFLDRARAAGAALELTAPTMSAVTQICHRLDGLPLAVELAAAWARLLPPAALLTRLERRLPLLVGGPHDLPARQRTMRDTIAWSYDLLDAREQRLFQRLCVFAGGCTAEAAEAVWEDVRDEAAVLARLAALVDRSLLQLRNATQEGFTDSRLIILETVREYGLDRLEESGEVEDVRRAHAAHYLALAEAAEAGQRRSDGAVWAARLEADHDNLRAALNWSITRGDGVMGLRLVAALWRFWLERGHLSEGRGWLRAALDLTDATGVADVSVHAEALLGAAHLAIDQGAYEEAEPHCAQVVALARERDSREDLVIALNLQGRLAWKRGEYEAATRCHEEALALAEALVDRPGMATALTGLGYATTFAGDVARGTALCEQGLALFRAAGDVRGLAEALVAIAVSTQHAGAFAPSEAYAAEALALFRVLGDTGRTAEALWVLGTSALVQEQYERAVTILEEDLALRRERGDEHGETQPLSALGLIALRQGNHRRARTLIEESLAVLERYDDRWSLAMMLTLLGHVELAADDPAQAAMHFARAAPLFRSVGNPLYVPWCLEGLAGVAAAKGAWELAAKLCGARDALHTRLGLGVPPADPVANARTRSETRAALGEDALAAAHEAGQSWSPDQAVAEARKIVPGGTRH